MKVLDLSCISGHVFEGWFASEGAYQEQLDKGLVACPTCSSIQVHKKMSAPRLNLSGASAPVSEATPMAGQSGSKKIADLSRENPLAERVHAELQKVISKVVEHVLAHTDDVGDRFAEEARRIHYGETQERAIRGQATMDEAKELVEEGIELVPIPLPARLKTTLQ